jgi:lipopolysaccharide export system permease protein
VVESSEQIAYGMLQTQRSYRTDDMSMNVQGTDGRMLLMPTLSLAAKGDKPGVTITAQKAEFRSDPEAGTFTIRFYDAVIDVGNRGGVIWPGVYEHVVALSEFSRKGGPSDSPSNRPLSEIPQDIAYQERHIDELKQQAAATAAFQLMTGDLPRLAGSEWRDRHGALAGAYERLYRLRGEPHRRWAAGFACLSFVLVGSAMAIRRRNGDFLTSFFLCFLPILLAYYPLLIYAIGRVKHGALPPYSAWLGNLVLLAWGLWMLRKVLRY